MRSLFRRFRPKKKEAVELPERFYPLAVYNSEHARGLVHTRAYTKRMKELQSEFIEWEMGMRVEMERANDG